MRSSEQPVFRVENMRVTLVKKAGRRRPFITDKERGQAILKGVSFCVSPGECLGILGESGSGKSVTVKAALGLLDSAFEIEGGAYLGDLFLQRVGASTLRDIRGGQIGVILQNPMTCFDPMFRIGMQMEETYRAHESINRKQARARSLHILEQVYIDRPDEVLEKYPHQLSGGMLQRIMIGLAASTTPKLLIADEPTTAIDAVTQLEILRELKKIQQMDNMAMIFISHDLGAISMIADRLIVMNQGRIVDEGTLDEIISNPKDRYTRLLIEKRSAVMERYRAVVEKGGEWYAQTVSR